MKKNKKSISIFIILIIGIVVVDTIQARIFKNSPIISWKSELEDLDSWVDRGILMDTYYCTKEKDMINVSWHLKFSKFTCLIDNFKGNDVTKEAKELFGLKNNYLGDNLADIRLLDKLEISKFSKYTIELETSKKPYVLYINFNTINPDNITNNILSNFKKEMKINSIILLALIENVDEIHYNDRFCDCIDNIVKLKANDLEKEYGNIKDYGKKVEKFQELLEKIKYNQ